MKLTGITGTGTGKLGSSVFAVNSGVQIVRQYQPVVSNPSTEAQVEQRAKLKLASQLARDLKLSIAIPRKGLVTSRNAFMSKNFGSITFENEQASADLQKIQLTESNQTFGSVTGAVINRDQACINVSLSGFSDAYWGGLIVAVYRPNTDNSLSFVKEENCDVEHYYADGVLKVPDIEQAIQSGDILYIYAYAPTSEDARVKYGNLIVNNTATIASLFTNRSLTAEDMQLSKTVYVRVSAS